MPIEYINLIELLKQEDVITICDLLDITSDELVSKFRTKVRQRRTYVESYLDDSKTELEEEFGIGVHIETWKDQLTTEDSFLDNDDTYEGY